MAIDRLTGIRIGGNIYREGVGYTDGAVLTDLLSKTSLGSLGSLSNLDARFDINKRRLSVLVSADVETMGFSIPASLKFVFKGVASGERKVAQDFIIKTVGAGIHTGGFVNTEAIATADIGALSINRALTTLATRPVKLLKTFQAADVNAYASGALATQVSSALASLSPTFGDRNTAVGSLASSFGSDWWSSGL
jgi:hypothetical protein